MIAKMRQELQVNACIECDKEVKWPRVLPYEGEEKPNGMTIDYYDEYQTSHLIGVLCKECAFDLCDKGIIAIGYAGFPYSWNAVVMIINTNFPSLKKTIFSVNVMNVWGGTNKMNGIGKSINKHNSRKGPT